MRQALHLLTHSLDSTKETPLCELASTAPDTRFQAGRIGGRRGPAGGKSAQQIATEHGAAVFKVRSRVNTLIAKVGVRRQSEDAGALTPCPRCCLR